MKRSWGLAGEVHPSNCGEGDVRKWEYAESACRDEFVTTPGRSMLSDPAFKDALAWEAALQPSELIRKREAMISKIEEADELMRSSGLCADWIAVADAEMRGVSAEANGELFQQLAAATEFVDAGAVPLLREGVPSLYRLLVNFICCGVLGKGAAVSGLLEATGLGEALPPKELKGTTFLKSFCQHSNQKLISQLKEAEQGAKMLQIARDDAKLGRLTEPRPIEAGTLNSVSLRMLQACVYSGV